MASELYVETLKGLTSGANANTVTVGSGQTLYAPGHVIQVVQGELSSTVDVVSTSYVDVYEATITPSSTSSKILVIASGSLRCAGGYTSTVYIGLHRGSSPLLISKELSASSSVPFFNYAENWLDSPNTASAVTYKVRGRVDISGDTYRFFNDQGGNERNCTITLMEIAG